jgi:two-component system, OmpR family, sensor kinase
VSLRARLLAGLVVLAAIGLVVMGAVTYAEQRSFLYQRVDQQLSNAAPEVSRALDDRGVNVAGGEQPPGPPGGGFRGGGVGPPVMVPPGTYGQRRDGAGRVLPGHVGESGVPAPKLPAKLPLSEPQRPHAVTVPAVSSSGPDYRAIAFPTRDQPGTTVVAIPLRDVSQTLDRLLVVELLVAAGVLLALVASAWVVIRFELRPLDRMGRIAGAIAAGDLSRRVTPATARTEVGRLGLALNAMLGQIERAFRQRRASEDRLRRFLADASHELRTPLASIRGYAELFRIGAARDEADVEKAMRRIEQEATRMGVLVEELLTLARLDELPEKPSEPVDLAQLARDAADDARATAPDRPVELSTDGPAVVLGDVDQLRQVVANLTRNALVHTPAGTTIELNVRAEPGLALLEVRDHGPGLPEGVTDAVFERFWRADPGRGRGVAGAGLGLAIVAAIVEGHGGHASARNAEGGGASFTIRIPSAAGAA